MQRHTVTATFGDTVLGRTDHALQIEGTYYIPEQDVTAELRISLLTTLCIWKGIARYQHLEIDGQTIRNAAWTYLVPSQLAWPIRRMVAFAPAAGIIVHREDTELDVPPAPPVHR
ncbi:MAG: DUF427 domain-containing protein [Brachybacterium sp.]|nr:DUF427 domain-containing protein [Brachybacterium sp.]